MNKQETEKQPKSLKEVEAVIAQAIKKIGAKKENELCKYIPMTSGGYMHHFTFKKKKIKDPKELSNLIEEFIINTDDPTVVKPKTRAARGSRKRRDQITFTRGQLERMLNIARLAGDNEIITVLSPKKSLAACKRELIQSIRQNKVEPELWNFYAESMNSQNPFDSDELKHAMAFDSKDESF
jgi:transketolase